MAGLFLIVLIGGYIFLAWWAIQKPRALWMKALLILAFVLIPTADEIYGRSKLNRLCENEGGLKVYATVDGVNGFRQADEVNPYGDWMKRMGYKFIEGRPKGTNQRVKRISLNAESILVTDVAAISIAEYELAKEETQKNGFLKSVDAVKELKSGKILGTFTRFAYYGGWARLLIPLRPLQPVSLCYNQEHFQGLTNLVIQTLKPTQ